MSTESITLHWLESSRSQRILWLLEELHLDYQLKLYHRDEEKRADPALLKLHPLGKAPLVEIEKGDGSTPMIIAESAHIISYLIRHFDSKGLLKPAIGDDEELVEYYLNYAEGSLQPFLTFLAVHGVVLTILPFWMKFIVGKFMGILDSNYTIPELKANLNMLEKNLREKEGVYFVGKKLSGADIILHFIIYEAFESEALKSWFTAENYPNLKKWIETVEQRPAFQRAVEKVKDLGHGEYEIGL